MLDAGGDFPLTCRQPSHKTLHEHLDGIRLPTRRRTVGRGAKRRIHRHRWINDLPIRDGDDALRVNWLEIASARPDGAVTCRGAFVASLHVDRDNVAELADCARARWKIENETFNVPGSTAATSNTTSATAGTTSPPCSSSSTCSPSPCTPPANSPRRSGSRPASDRARRQRGQRAPRPSATSGGHRDGCRTSWRGLRLSISDVRGRAGERPVKAAGGFGWANGAGGARRAALTGRGREPGSKESTPRAALPDQPAFRSSSRTTRRSVSSSSSAERCSRSAWLMAVW